MGNAIVGTLFLVGLACLIGLPVGIGAGRLPRRDGRRPPSARAVRFTAEVLSGVPSIVVGIVAYGLVVVPMKRFSRAGRRGWRWRCSWCRRWRAPPRSWCGWCPPPCARRRWRSGVPQWKTSLRIVLRTALGGIVTAVLLAVARAAGETAPLLFTALNNQYWNMRPDQPTASLTVQIFNYAISPYEDWHQKAWSAALVLLLLVGGLNLRRAPTDAQPAREGDVMSAVPRQPWPEKIRVERLERVVRRHPGRPRQSRSACQPDSVMAIIGPSGCGKSTFLRCLNRMHELVPGARAAGRVLLDGEDIYVAGGGPGAAAPARGHGLPAAQPLSHHVHLRQRGGGAQAQRLERDTPARRGALPAPGGALGRGEGPAARAAR